MHLVPEQKHRAPTQQNTSQPILLTLEPLTIRNDYCCCLPLACPLSGYFWDLLSSPISHLEKKTQSKHGLALDFSRLLVRFKIFLAWSWAQFDLENSCTVFLRQIQSSIKGYSQNCCCNPPQRWPSFSVIGGEQHNFGREIHPACTITLLPQPHLPPCPPSSLED